MARIIGFSTWILNVAVFSVLGCWCLLFVSGCAVGPNYKRPSFDSPTIFRGDNAPTNKSFADLKWWNVYQDARLQALMRGVYQQL
jgi:multidrug efflux system outer membrane protein